MSDERLPPALQIADRCLSLEQVGIVAVKVLFPGPCVREN